MKRVWAILLAAALLVCLAGCGKEEAEFKQAPAEKSAEAKGPFTFAGVGWDTPIEACEAALEKGTGVQFTRLEEPDPANPDWVTYGAAPASFAAAPGHYTILGMTIDATPDGVLGFDPGIFACYTLPTDGAERKLDMIHIGSNRYALPADPETGRPDWSQLEAAREIFREVDKRYGENTCVYLQGSSWDDYDLRNYTVPEKELPYLFQDAVAYAEAMEWNNLCIGLAQDNVDCYVIINLPDDDADGWYYTMNLEYLGCPWTESAFGQELAAGAVPFPWVNGKPDYVVIDP